MNEDRPPSFEELDKRLRKARERGSPQGPAENRDDGVSKSAIGTAFRIGVELTAALIVGVGSGLLIDRWLGTKPWGLLVMFFMGAGAGILNVYRAVSGVGLAAGYRPPGRDDTDTRKDS